MTSLSEGDPKRLSDDLPSGDFFADSLKGAMLMAAAHRGL